MASSSLGRASCPHSAMPGCPCPSLHPPHSASCQAWAHCERHCGLRRSPAPPESLSRAPGGSLGAGGLASAPPRGIPTDLSPGGGVLGAPTAGDALHTLFCACDVKRQNHWGPQAVLSVSSAFLAVCVVRLDEVARNGQDVLKTAPSVQTRETGQA